MNGNAFALQRRTDLDGGLDMTGQQIMYAVGGETRASGIGKQDLSITAWGFAKPGFQRSGRGLGERHTAFFATLSDHANVSTDAERDIPACQPGHFRQTKPRLRRYSKEGVVAPAEPAALIGRGEQCLDFRTGEEMHQCPRKALAGNGQDALDLGSMVRHFECGIPKEGVDGRKSQIPAACAQPAILLQVVEKRHDQRSIDGLEGEQCWLGMQSLLYKF